MLPRSNWWIFCDYVITTGLSLVVPHLPGADCDGLYQPRHDQEPLQLLPETDILTAVVPILTHLQVRHTALSV